MNDIPMLDVSIVGGLSWIDGLIAVLATIVIVASAIGLGADLAHVFFEWIITRMEQKRLVNKKAKVDYERNAWR